MAMNKKSILTIFKEYSLITLGILLYVTGWAVFLVPNNLVGGGVSGVASIIQYGTRGFIKIGTTYFVINAILLVIALFTLGKSFGGKTVFAVILASVGLNVFQDLIPAEIIQTLAIDNGKLMSTIMGGIMVGVGIGLTMSQGGSSGGTVSFISFAMPSSRYLLSAIRWKRSSSTASGSCPFKNPAIFRISSVSSE